MVLVYIHPMVRWILERVGKLPGKMSAGNIRQNLGRTGVAVAAFMIALSMSIGLGAMIGSFRQSLIWWMGTQIRGDLYIGKVGEAVDQAWLVLYLASEASRFCTGQIWRANGGSTTGR